MSSIQASALRGKVKNREAIKIKGAKVRYSHIASKIDGEALKEANKFTQFPQTTPYYKITVLVGTGDVNAFDRKSVLEFDASDQSQTMLAAYVGSKFYNPKKEDSKNEIQYSVISKGNEIRVFKEDAQGKLHRVNLNGNELAQDVNIDLVVNYFETSNGAGVGINAVIIKDAEIRTFEGNTSVMGYDSSDIADDEISLEPRKAVVQDDIPDDTAVSDNASETASSAGAVEVEETPVGSVNNGSNTEFDNLLADFMNS